MVKKVIVASIDKELHSAIERLYFRKAEANIKNSKKPISKSKIIENLLYAGWYSVVNNLVTEDFIEKEIKKKLF